MTKAALITLFIILFTVTASNALITSSEESLKPDSAKQCSICHFSWVDTFFVDKKSSVFAALPDKPVAASIEMCFSCHDGSTVDSRKKVMNDRRHQVGVTPSEKIKVPEIFPLDEEGRMDCATCHSAHAESRDYRIEKTVFLRTSNKNSRMCKMCHQDKVGGPENGNHPIDKTSLKMSDQINRYGGLAGDKPNQVICESCHVAHGGFTDNRLVMPADRPSEFPVLCEQCHGKTAGLNSEKGKTTIYSHSVDVMPKNAEIPVKWKNGNLVRLGKKGHLICVSCHTVHNPAVNNALLSERSNTSSLCTQCHQTQGESIRETKHDLNLISPDTVNVSGKTVSESGLCSSCHLAHNGTGPYTWARPFVGKEKASVEICTSCHKKAECAEKALIPETGHPVGIKPDNEEKPVRFPFFTSDGKRSEHGEIYCSTCHNSHQWDPKDPGNKGSKDLKGDLNNSFLRVSNNGSVLCLGCHKEQETIAGTDHDLSLSLPEEKNISGQSPAESGLCGSCHLAHGGSDLFMFGRKLDPEEGQLMAMICLECHRENSCADEKKIGDNFHPININLKNSSKIRLPLYTQDGKKDPATGMIYCSTCHNPHQWDPDNPEKKGGDGTLSDSFLRYESAANSPLCVECHQDKAFIEGTDHDLRVTAPDETGNQGLLPPEAGLCQQCHAVHNALTPVFLMNRQLGPSVILDWNTEFTAEKNFMTGLCTCCHQKGQCAEVKLPEYGLHPSSPFMTLILKKNGSMDPRQFDEFIGQFPLFTDNGEKSVKGSIVCTTCHETHLWNSHYPGKGSGEETEGNSISSFLRKDIEYIFCAKCHGEDALYKFKFFHRIKSRKKTDELTVRED